MSNGCVEAWPPDGRGVPRSYTLFCPPLVTSPRIAREFGGVVLGSLGLKSIVDAVTLCTSEVVTNAVVHATGVGSLLWLSVGARDVRITVYDGSCVEPRLRVVSETGESGRGLHLVAALADEWGTVRGAPLGLGGKQGKGVWFRVAQPGQG